MIPLKVILLRNMRKDRLHQNFTRDISLMSIVRKLIILLKNIRSFWKKLGLSNLKCRLYVQKALFFIRRLHGILLIEKMGAMIQIRMQLDIAI